MAVYLIRHDSLKAVKIGIGVVNNNRFPRLRRHQQRGWQVHAVWIGLRVEVAVAVERDVVKKWRKAGIQEGVTNRDMPQGGFSETASLLNVNLDDIVGQVTLAINRYSDPDAN